MKTVPSPLMMNQMRRILLLIGALMMLVAPVWSQAGQKAEDLVRVCREAEKVMDGGSLKGSSRAALYAGTCFGYFAGALATHTLYQRFFDEMKATPGWEHGEALFCTHNAINSGEAVKVFLKYMKDHPEKLHENQHMMVLDALTAAFPCKP